MNNKLKPCFCGGIAKETEDKLTLKFPEYPKPVVCTRCQLSSPTAEKWNELPRDESDEIQSLKTLAANGWALIPVAINHGDDSSFMWIIVGYFMGDKPQRVIGESWEEDNPHLAIQDALKTIEKDSNAYKYEYKPNH